MKIKPFSLIVCLAIILPITAYSSNIINPKNGVLNTNGTLVWYEAALLGIEGKGWTNTISDYDRLPITAKKIVRKAIWNLGKFPSGFLVRFKTNAKTINVNWILTNPELAVLHMPATGVSGIDLYARNKKGELRFCANGRPHSISNNVKFTLPVSQEYVIYFPTYNELKSLKIGIPKGKYLSKLSSPTRSIVFYGTSITQGGCASRPGMITTSIIGRELGVSIINLGFSGNGKMEIELADVISELNPDIYVLDTLWNMTPKMVSDRVVPFVKRLRKSHPTTPILLVEDSNFNDLPTVKGDILRKIYTKLIKEGDKNLYFLSNKNMLGTDGEATVDRCHFNDLGMMRQADVYIKFLKPILKK